MKKTTKKKPAVIQAEPAHKQRQPGAYTMKLRENHAERQNVFGPALRSFLPDQGIATTEVLKMCRVLAMVNEEVGHLLGGFTEGDEPDECFTTPIKEHLKGASDLMWKLLAATAAVEDVTGCLLDLESPNQI